ncbi:TdeIII family type II restriction endonuclease [Staphylococcus epidermidis]|nr:TdeIII family type II restriction endonuclease [Staphylococcus epidermidis]
MDNNTKEKIACEVIKTLHKRFLSFPSEAKENRNAPFHEAFLEAFSTKLEDVNINDRNYLITLSSWLHGLNTALGQSFFENVSYHLSDGEKRTFKNISLPSKVVANNNIIMSHLKNGEKVPDVEGENKLIDELLSDSGDSGCETVANFTADLYVESDEEVSAFEIKSVRPNSGEMRGEKEKILRGKSYLKKEYPNKKVNFFLAVPYDPTEDRKTPTKYNKTRYMNYAVEFKKFIDKNELLLASEYWDYISGEKNTMENILEIIRKIATPDFENKYKFINDRKNLHVDQDKYVSILTEWELNTELKIVANDEKIEEEALKNKKIAKFKNNRLFKKDGTYDRNRILKFYENELI